jgi:hypothetical protein
MIGGEPDIAPAIRYTVEIYTAGTGFVHQYRDGFKSYAEAHSYGVSQTAIIRAKADVSSQSQPSYRT